MELTRISKNPEKEVFTIKAGEHYLGFIVGDEDLYLIPEMFESPLVASNKARSLKRIHKIEANVKKNTKLAVKSKVRPKCVLYTETEVAKLTHLRFREAWLILAPQGGYVENVMENKKVVDYTQDASNAKVFKSYEDASDYVKTLDMVIRKGHTLRRYFVQTNKDNLG